MTIYDDVERDARDDHRHNPPGYAARPTGRACPVHEVGDDDCAPSFGAPCTGHLLPPDQVLEQWHEDHYHDARFGAFDETPDSDSDEAA